MTQKDRERNEASEVEDANEDLFFVPRGTSESKDHRTSGMSGEAELIWRCSACGEVGEIEEIPSGCPACQAPKSELYYCTED